MEALLKLAPLQLLTRKLDLRCACRELHDRVPILLAHSLQIACLGSPQDWPALAEVHRRLLS